MTKTDSDEQRRPDTDGFQLRRHARRKRSTDATPCRPRDTQTPAIQTLHANHGPNTNIAMVMYRNGSRTRTVVRECCKGDDASQWENWKFDPCSPKPLNRSSKKLHTYVITSWVSTDMQNLVMIPQGVSLPLMGEIAHQNVYSASFLGSSNDLYSLDP